MSQIVIVDGGRVLSRVPMHVAGRHARLRMGDREHAVPLRFQRPIWFRGQSLGPVERAIAEGV